MSTKLSPVVSILVGVALIAAMAVLQAGFLPTAVVAAVGPAVVVVSTIYGISPAQTARLLQAKLNPHIVAAATALLGAAAGLLPLVAVGSVLRVVIGTLLAVGGVLLPGTAIGTAASAHPAKPQPKRKRTRRRETTPTPPPVA